MDLTACHVNAAFIAAQYAKLAQLTAPCMYPIGIQHTRLVRPACDICVLNQSENSAQNSATIGVDKIVDTIYTFGFPHFIHP